MIEALTLELPANFELNCFKATSDEWYGNFQLIDEATKKPEGSMMQLSFFGGYDFEHLHYELLEIILDEYKGDEEGLNRDHGIYCWYISASGTDDYSLVRKYRDAATALNEYHQLMGLEEVNYSDINKLTGEKAGH